jgi:hypothetical protein
MCMTQGCSVVPNRWRPSALGTGEIFTVPTNAPATINYEMKMLDGWGEERVFELAMFSTYGDQITLKKGSLNQVRHEEAASIASLLTVSLFGFNKDRKFIVPGAASRPDWR